MVWIEKENCLGDSTEYRIYEMPIILEKILCEDDVESGRNWCY